MSALTELAEHIRRTTIEYRKGDAIEAKGGAIHVYAMPETPDRGVLVDVHFVNVGFTEAADRDEFVRLLAAACGPGEFLDVSVADLMGGPSYITLGAWIGSQDLALRLIALGKLHDLWSVVTPGVLGIDGPDADRMAGGGFVMPAPKAELRGLLEGAVAR